MNEFTASTLRADHQPTITRKKDMLQNAIQSRPVFNEAITSPQQLRSAPIPLAIAEMQENTEYLTSALGNLEDRLSAVLGPPRTNETTDEKRCAAPAPQVSGVATVIQAQVTHLQRLRQQVEAITSRLEL